MTKRTTVKPIVAPEVEITAPVVTTVEVTPFDGVDVSVTSGEITYGNCLTIENIADTKALVGEPHAFSYGTFDHIIMHSDVAGKDAVYLGYPVIVSDDAKHKDETVKGYPVYVTTLTGPFTASIRHNII